MTTSESLPEVAFEALVAADARRLYTLALSILRDEGEAEDAVQETLLKAWRSWPSIGDSDHLPRWLTRVCVNHCTSISRRLRARGGPPLELFEWAGSSGGQSNAAEVMDVDRAYRHLSIRQRAAITLNYAYGYSVEEFRRFDGMQARHRAHARRARARVNAKGAGGCLRPSPNSTASCAPCTTTSRLRTRPQASPGSRRGRFAQSEERSVVSPALPDSPSSWRASRCSRLSARTPCWTTPPQQSAHTVPPVPAVVPSPLWSPSPLQSPNPRRALPILPNSSLLPTSVRILVPETQGTGPASVTIVPDGELFIQYACVGDSSLVVNATDVLGPDLRPGCSASDADVTVVGTSLPAYPNEVLKASDLRKPVTIEISTSPSTTWEIFIAESAPGYAPNLLANGGFETPIVTDLTPPITSLPGWSITEHVWLSNGTPDGSPRWTDASTSFSAATYAARRGKSPSAWIPCPGASTG